MTIEVPRDRDGSFEPAIMAKRQRRLSSIDEIVLSTSFILHIPGDAGHEVGRLDPGIARVVVQRTSRLPNCGGPLTLQADDARGLATGRLGGQFGPVVVERRGRTGS